MWPCPLGVSQSNPDITEAEADRDQEHRDGESQVNHSNTGYKKETHVWKQLVCTVSVYSERWVGELLPFPQLVREGFFVIAEGQVRRLSLSLDSWKQKSYETHRDLNKEVKPPPRLGQLVSTRGWVQRWNPPRQWWWGTCFGPNGKLKQVYKKLTGSVCLHYSSWDLLLWSSTFRRGESDVEYFSQCLHSWRVREGLCRAQGEPGDPKIQREPWK